MVKFTLITGASSGIGKAIAEYCAAKKMNLLLIARSNEKLEKVAQEINEKYDVITYFFEIDLTGQSGPLMVHNWVKENNYAVNILVNNAGIAGTSVFENSVPEYNDERIMVNIRALVLLCNYFIPELKKHDKSYILNIGSLSAFFSIPYKAVYSASKAFVVNFSRALKYELKDTSVNVSVVCPNGVRTNAGTYARIDSHGIKGRITTIPVELLARKSIENMLKGKFLFIPLGINRFIYFLGKIIPDGLLQKILVKEFSREVKVC
jgi:short-subunit dehydrogenase